MTENLILVPNFVHLAQILAPEDFFHGFYIY